MKRARHHLAQHLKTVASVVGVFALLTTLISVTSLAARPGEAMAAPADDEQAFVQAINELRASKGVPALQVHPQLTVLARNFAPRMVERGQIFHNPDLSKQAPDTWQKLGENVGVGGTVASLHQAFVDSPGHYRNLVDPSYRYIGVGVVHANGRMWVVEDFMGSDAPLPQVQPPKSNVTSKAGMATRFQLALKRVEG